MLAHHTQYSRLLTNYIKRSLHLRLVVTIDLLDALVPKKGIKDSVFFWAYHIFLD